MGQRRATAAFVYLSQVADALGTNPAGASRRLKSKGVQAQVLREKGREKKVFLVDDVKQLGLTYFGGEAVGFLWKTTTDVAEILEIPPSNVVKTLERYGVESQVLKVGERAMRVFLWEDVKRVKQARAAKRGKSRAAA